MQLTLAYARLKRQTSVVFQEAAYSCSIGRRSGFSERMDIGGERKQTARQSGRHMRSSRYSSSVRQPAKPFSLSWVVRRSSNRDLLPTIGTPPQNSLVPQIDNKDALNCYYANAEAKEALQVDKTLAPTVLPPAFSLGCTTDRQAAKRQD